MGLFASRASPIAPEKHELHCRPFVAYFKRRNCTQAPSRRDKMRREPLCLIHRELPGGRLHVVTEQRVLIPNVELAVRDHRMRPGWLDRAVVRAVGLSESPALEVFLAA